MKQKVVMVWSGGKDSSLALYRIMKSDKYEVCHLLTSMNSATQRVSMHGVHKELLITQAQSIGLPITFVEYQEASYDAYEKAMSSQINQFQSQGINSFVFGDIFLEDLRIYREEQLAKVKAKAIFPLWSESTTELAKSFVNLGFKSVVCCIDAKKLSSDLLGKTITHEWINRLPNHVDPCGEHGEFHTFCFDGPLFDKPIDIQLGKKLIKEYEHEGQVSQFEFVDLGIV